MRKKTVKEFLKGTRNKHTVSISDGTNENVVFEDTYENFKRSGKEYFDKPVQSWDVVEMADGTLEIGIMI